MGQCCAFGRSRGEYEYIPTVSIFNSFPGRRVVFQGYLGVDENKFTRLSVEKLHAETAEDFRKLFKSEKINIIAVSEIRGVWHVIIEKLK